MMEKRLVITYIVLYTAIVILMGIGIFMLVIESRTRKNVAKHNKQTDTGFNTAILCCSFSGILIVVTVLMNILFTLG